MDTQDTLRRIGLDKKQAAIYLAALELGEASMTELAKRASLKRPTAYLAVNDLEVLGLLSEVMRGRRRVFSPVHPRRLLGIVQTRLRDVEDALPELIAIYNAPKDKPKIQVFEGIEGVRSLYRDLYQSLSGREETLWFARISALRSVPEAISEYKKILRRLSNPLIRELNYGDDEGKGWSKDIEKLRGKNHHIRVLPTEFEFGFSDGLIFGNKLVVFSLKKDIFVIVIESQSVTQTFRAMFEWAWKQGKEV